MFRYPNPGSNLENFIKILKILCDELRNCVFDLDDMVHVVVKKQYASSRGYIGSKAIEASKEKDRSRDPLYNQLKMYAELYRHLGFIKSKDKALSFVFTSYGLEFCNSLNPNKEFIIALLSLSYPNHSIKTKDNAFIKPFYTILKIIDQIDNYITRDEVIAFILCEKNDQKPENVRTLIINLLNSRKNKNLLEIIKSISDSTSIKINTLRNYTRIPIMFLRDTGLFRIENNKMFLTDLGAEYSRLVKNSFDIRLETLKQIFKNNDKDHNSYLRYLAFSEKKHSKNFIKYFHKYKKIFINEVFFNPFQMFNLNQLEKILNFQTNLSKYERKYVESELVEKKYEENLSNKIIFDKLNLVSGEKIKLEFLKNIKKTQDQTKIINTAEEFANNCRLYKKEKFYPLVNELFKIIGFDSKVSRYGVNYQRWDSAIEFKNKLIPIEIKSPTEEEYIGIKSIRQALENKIILESRYPEFSEKKYTSLIVGYKLPKKRSDLNKLIIDISNTLSIKIGIIDIFTLSKIIFLSLLKNKKVNSNQLVHLKGFLSL